MGFKTTTEKIGLNQALFNVTHGLYILTSKNSEKINGQCLDALMQVTNAPPCVALGVNKGSLTHDMIMESKQFVINVLDKEDPGWRDKVKLFGFKSGRNIDKFTGDIKYKLSDNGIPILLEAKAFFECELKNGFPCDLATHSLFVGKVIKAGAKEEGKRLTYNEYRTLIRK